MNAITIICHKAHDMVSLDGSLQSLSTVLRSFSIISDSHGVIKIPFVCTCTTYEMSMIG